MDSGQKALSKEFFFISKIIFFIKRASYIYRVGSAKQGGE